MSAFPRTSITGVPLAAGFVAVVLLAITQHLIVGESAANDWLNSPSTFRTYFSLMSGGGPSGIAACATLTVLMGDAFSYHGRRRTELVACEPTHPAIVHRSRSPRGHVIQAAVSDHGTAWSTSTVQW